MLEEIRSQLQQVIETAPTGELAAVRTRLEELGGLLYQVAGTSTNDDVRQALQLFGIAHEKVSEAVQAVAQATDHVSTFSAVL
ncbi:hypothetical protein SAMN04487819_112119 [Actinopolyspora alba]|uniref:Uncharacterized protein n=1 Tax=Actinopolyspora alba TaxID=673379 RepID=A0A1I2A3W6_9ACTN|nr:hypothetical protein [Actinopolyspora alba]SFE38834.1 hypothetical protein SAMN04487819_112119 [Actinopolyspora alba]